MKIVIAPDSFKGSMSALKVSNAIERGIKRVLPNAETIKMPMADGGEGTVETLVNVLGGKRMAHTVTGPLGEQLCAQFGVIHSDTAVIEIASVIGLPLVPLDKRNPMHTTTNGVGELILYALDQGIRSFIIGLGGSSTNDGGIGMMQALGAEITDRTGNPVSPCGAGLGHVAHISIDSLDQRLLESSFTIATDVINPLTGPNGASYTYGPQKGADAKMVQELDYHMKKYADMIKRDVQKDVAQRKGAGTGGGLGAACMAFLDAKVKPGIDLVIEMTDLEAVITSADLVFTGEGKIDDQTIYGKAPAGVAEIAKKYAVPVIAVAGANKVTTPDIYDKGIHAIFSMTDGPVALEDAMVQGEMMLEKLVENIMRMILSLQQ